MFSCLPKAILFDLDNTLTHRNDSIARFAHQFNREFSAQLKFTDTQYLQENLQRIDNGGRRNPDNRYPSIKESIADFLTHRLSWKNCPGFENLLSYWMEVFPACSVPMPGAAELLASLQAQQIKMAVISNGKHSSRVSTLQHLGFLSYFECVVSSSLLNIKKPEPEPVLAGLAQLKVAAEDSWLVGDDIVNDLQAAKAAGVKGIWLKGFDARPADWYGDSQIEKLSDILRLLQACPGRKSNEESSP